MPKFPWESVPVLLTPRLALRALAQHDREDLFAIYSDPEVMRFASDPTFPDLSYVEQMLASVAALFQQQQAIEWGVTLRDDPRIIGTCGLHSFEAETHAAEVGCLLKRSQWGQSIMGEALEAVITFGFDAFDLDTIRADIDAPNTRSINLFRRLGFRQNRREGAIYTLSKKAWSSRM